MFVFQLIFSIFAFILGAAFGSFAGLIAYRYSRDLSIVKPNSYCPNCKKPIKPFDNIPIVSWIFLGGKCRNCKSKIGIFSLLLEICGGVGFMSAYLQYGDTFDGLPIFIALMILVFQFLVIAAIDYETHYIYNITIIIFAVLSVFIAIYRIIMFDSAPLLHMIGALFGLAFFGIIKLITKMFLKKEALGSGDVYLVVIAGFMLGIFQLLIAIMIASVLGSIIEIIKIKSAKSNREDEIAFAPYLLLGIGLMAIYGEAAENIYWEVMLNAL